MCVFSKMLPYVKFAEDKVLVFFVLRDCLAYTLNAHPLLFISLRLLQSLDQSCGCMFLLILFNEVWRINHKRRKFLLDRSIAYYQPVPSDISSSMRSTRSGWVYLHNFSLCFSGGNLHVDGSICRSQNSHPIY